MARELTPDQRRARTRKEKYGEDFNKRIGSIGGKNNRKNLTSEFQQKAAKARWDKYRAEKAKQEKGEDE